MTIVDRFLKYVSYDTQSCEASTETPSSAGQKAFVAILKKELEQEGFSEIDLDENGYLYATLPATISRPLPVVGFIAHYDTSPDCSGKDIKPRIVKQYDGKEIILDGDTGVITSPQKFPELLAHIGEDLIVTNGHTLLGADDKAGIAEIIQAMVYLREHPEIEHGKIRIAFNPDEEIGLGAHKFDVRKFGCDWAYTMDGGEVGELEFENFNAAYAQVAVSGTSVHPGYAKGKMINAIRIAAEFVSQLPQKEAPESTEGYEGFYHLLQMSGGIENASLSLIVRDHDRVHFGKRKEYLKQIAENLNKKYGKGTLSLSLKDQYYNMREMIEPKMHIIDLATEAFQRSGVRPKIKAIRGGTDGAQLSFKGLPCPNIFAGGLNFHGPHEFLPTPSLEKGMRVIIEICRLIPQKY